MPSRNRTREQTWCGFLGTTGWGETRDRVLTKGLELLSWTLEYFDSFLWGHNQTWMFLVGSIFLRVTCWLRIGQISCSIRCAGQLTRLQCLKSLAYFVLIVLLPFANQPAFFYFITKCSGQLTRLQCLKSLAWSFFNIFILDKIIYRAYIYIIKIKGLHLLVSKLFVLFFFWFFYLFFGSIK